MAATDAPGPTRAKAPWRDVLTGITALLLFVVAVGHMTYVVPVFRAYLASSGTVLSWPSRVAIGVSRFGALLMLLWAAALIVAYWKDRRAPAGRLATVLAVSAALLAVYLGLVCWVYLDAARALP